MTLDPGEVWGDRSSSRVSSEKRRDPVFWELGSPDLEGSREEVRPKHIRPSGDGETSASSAGLASQQAACVGARWKRSGESRHKGGGGNPEAASRPKPEGEPGCSIETPRAPGDGGGARYRRLEDQMLQMRP